MASEILQVGDYVRWDKSDGRAAGWAKDYGDGVMIVSGYWRGSSDTIELKFADTGRKVGLQADPSPGFFMHRFVKDVFLSAASQANRKETNGNTEACEGE